MNNIDGTWLLLPLLLFGLYISYKMIKLNLTTPGLNIWELEGEWIKAKNAIKGESKYYFWYSKGKEQRALVHKDGDVLLIERIKDGEVLYDRHLIHNSSSKETSN